MIQGKRNAALSVVVLIALSGGMALARGFGGRGGGGFSGGDRASFGGGGYGGMSQRSFDSFHAGGYGGYGGESHASSSSFQAGSRSGGGYGSYSGRNPYSGGEATAGSRSGSYTTQRGGTVNYGAAGVGGRGDAGGVAGRGVYGVQGTTANGREYGTAGRVGGAVGPNGNAVGGRSSVGAVSGPNGTAFGGSRSATAIGPNGAARVDSRGGVAVGANGGGAAWGYGGGGYRGAGGNAYGAYHQGWVHGSWNGHDSAAWGWRGSGWGVGLGVGLGWGLASWGYGSSLYGMGYSSYANPYYAPTMVAAGGYDYSQPIDSSSPAVSDAVSAPVMSSFDSAREAFKQKQYDQALEMANDALTKLPNDSDIHQFRAVCLFALGRYDESAASLYSVLSVEPGWDWTTLVGLYPDVDTYTGQLRTLESFRTANPTSASSRFVLGYLYLTEEQSDAAIVVLKEVVLLKPDDTLSAKLVRQLDPAKAAPATAVVEAPAAPPIEATPPPGASITGNWAAQPVKDTAIVLVVQPGGAFSWKITQGGRTQQFAGTSTFADGYLTLVRDQGPPLVGRVSWKDSSHMSYRIVGEGPDDPGLSFTR